MVVKPVYVTNLFLLRKTSCHYASFKYLSSSTPRLTITKFGETKTGDYKFKPPVIRNQYQSDIFLQCLLKYYLPPQVLHEVEPDLHQFGDLVAGPIYQLHLQCEAEPPRLEQYDAWGNRVDKLVTSDAWKAQKRISAAEGLVSIGHERKYSEYSRIYQLAKLMLYGPSAGMYSCPLAMTDGAARTLELLGDGECMHRARQNLISRDPDKFWTSGQWMTEKGGGSDVGNGTETLAVPQSGGSYALHGYKWFSSATDSEMTLALARIVDDDGKVTQGTKGLSMFYLETRDSEGNSNNICINKLKNKLGTRQLPTAELLLNGARAYLIGEPGRGVSCITNMLGICRFYNSLFAASPMRRMVYMATEYSKNRSAFGKPICQHPLHVATLAQLELDAQASAVLVFELSHLIGRLECNTATDDDKTVLRVLTPIAKLYTAKKSVALMSEGLECFGGQGYIEDTGLPSMLRDAQVLPIWEGTTNVLSMDLLRALSKSRGEALKVFLEVCQRDLGQGKTTLHDLMADIQWTSNAILEGRINPELVARDLAWNLAELYIGVTLNRMVKTHPEQFTKSANRWNSREFLSLKKRCVNGFYSAKAMCEDIQFVYKDGN